MTRLVGRSCELQRLVRYMKPSEINPKKLVLVYGPSGIGKTTLARAALHELEQQGYLAVYISLHGLQGGGLEPLYRIVEGVFRASSLESIPQSLRALVRDVGLGVVAGKISELTGDRLRRFVDALVKHDIADYYRFVLGLAAGAGEKGAAIVIDEAQHLIGLDEQKIRGFIKLVADIQYDLASSGKPVKVTLVTSDYTFGAKLLEHQPSPLYVTSYYLGEMSKPDTYALINENEIEVGEDLLEAIGGHPQLLLTLREPGPEDICDIYEQAYLRLMEEASKPEGLALLAGLAQAPLEIAVLGDKRSAAERLVKSNILQYGCSRHLGIYRWNREEKGRCAGGGICAPTVVAPANRVILAAMIHVLYEACFPGREEPGRIPEPCRSLLGTSPPDWLMERRARFMEPLERLCG